MDILNQIKKISEAMANMEENRVAIVDIIPKNWHQLKKLIIAVLSILLGLAMFTLILSFFI